MLIIRRINSVQTAIGTVNITMIIPIAVYIE